MHLSIIWNFTQSTASFAAARQAEVHNNTIQQLCVCRDYKPTVLAGSLLIGPLHDPVTWYKISHGGTQVTQWDFQNKGRSSWTCTGSFDLEVPLCNLHPSMADFVPYDWAMQGAYWEHLILRMQRASRVITACEFHKNEDLKLAMSMPSWWVAWGKCIFDLNQEKKTCKS